MTTIAIALLLAAALLGILLAALHGMNRRPGGPPWALGAVHGLLGLAAVGSSLAALRRPSADAAGLLPVALVFLTGALLLGLAPIVARLRRRPMSALVLGFHATLAIMGLVTFYAYTAVPG